MESRTALWLVALLVVGCRLPLPDPSAVEDGASSGTDAGSWSWRAVALSHPNTLHGLWGSSESDVWAVGNGGLILHHDGKAWGSVPSPTSTDLNAVWGAGQAVWAVGDGGTILRRNGGAWTEETSPVQQDLNGVWSDGVEAWAVGAGGTLLHHDGTSWKASSEGTDDLKAVWGSSPTDVWAVGSNGALLHNSGGTWARSPAVTTRTVFGVWGSSATDVYAVAAGGAVLHHDGSSWTLTDVDAGVTFRAVAGQGASGAVWAVGDRGGDGVIHGLQGGKGWQPASGLPGAILHAVWVAPSGQAWAVGGGTGEALRYGP